MNDAPAVAYVRDGLEFYPWAILAVVPDRWYYQQRVTLRDGRTLEAKGVDFLDRTVAFEPGEVQATARPPVAAPEQTQ